eukprot:1790166-Pleurochrysis_carterae.AAC.1
MMRAGTLSDGEQSASSYYALRKERPPHAQRKAAKTIDVKLSASGIDVVVWRHGGVVNDRATGCSSCWDGFGKFEDRLASVTCRDRYSCASVRMQNGFPRHAEVVLEVLGRQSITRLRGPLLACNQFPAYSITSHAY